MKDFDSINEAGEILSEHAICFTITSNIKPKGRIALDNYAVYITNYEKKVLVCCEGIVSVVVEDKTESINEGDVLYIAPNACVTKKSNNQICGIAMSHNKIAQNGENIVSMLIDFVKRI